jgi:hypothetical protein
MRYLLFLLLNNLAFASAICQSSKLDKFIAMTNQMNSEQELVTGVKPSALKTVGDWSPFARQDMNEIWQSISLKGVNYYSLGEPQKDSNYSQRSDCKSPYYQAWFGTYIIDAKNQLFDFPNEDINAGDIKLITKLLDIGALDQSSWLYAMKDPNGFASTFLIIPKRKIDAKEITIDGQPAHIIEFSMNSHSDLTDSTGGLINFIGMPDKKNWVGNLQANHHITINGFYIYWYNKEDKTLKIIYGTGCSYKGKDNSNFDSYPLLKDGMLKMAKELIYIKTK